MFARFRVVILHSHQFTLQCTCLGLPCTCNVTMHCEQPHLGHSIVSPLQARHHAGNIGSDTPGPVTNSSFIVEHEVRQRSREHGPVNLVVMHGRERAMTKTTATVIAVPLRFVVEEEAATVAAVQAVTEMTVMQQPPTGGMRSGHLEVTRQSLHSAHAAISCPVQHVLRATIEIGATELTTTGARLLKPPTELCKPLQNL